MPRLIKSPNSGSTIINAVTPEQGGHGEVTARDALEAMDLVSRDSIGKFGRPIPLDENGYIDQKYLQDLYASMETISGDGSIEVNQTKEYFLTGYDAFSNYDVRAVSGTVSRDRNVITYTAPEVPGQGGFTINGRMVALTVTDANIVEGIAAPVILTPVRGTSGLMGPVSVTSAPFVTDNGETHASTSWQCAEDPDFTTIVASVDQSVANKTSWSIGTVTLGKHYFIRAKYHGSGGSVSPWSEETHFTSPVPTPADRPNITSPVNGATRLPSRVTLTSSPYSTVTGDPHVSSSWQISENSLFTSIAFELTNSTVNKTSWQVSGLQPAKEYYARVRYRGQLHEYTEWSPASSFRTRLAFLPETEIGKSGSYNGVTADMDDVGGRWIVGNGSSDITGVNCAAYIYRREGGLPVLEDTVQAVVGEKTLTSTIPSGGQLTVTVAGRYSSTKSYTQAEEIIIPAGAQSLTLVGKGSSANEVTAFLVGSGSVQIPAGTTNLKLIGKGSDGSYSPPASQIQQKITGHFNSSTDASVWSDGWPVVMCVPVSGGFACTSYEYVTVEQPGGWVDGQPTTLTIQGQTYTYPGGVGGPATPRTDNITLNGTAQALSYNIPTGGSGQYGYPGSTGVSQSLIGTGEYIFPLGTPKVTITAKGGDGSPVIVNGIPVLIPHLYPQVLPGRVSGRRLRASSITANPSSILNVPVHQMPFDPRMGDAGPRYAQVSAVMFFDEIDSSGNVMVPNYCSLESLFVWAGNVIHDGLNGAMYYANDFSALPPDIYGEFFLSNTGQTAGVGFMYIQSYIAIPATTGAPSTFTIQGITKTFPGGNGGPATATTQEITLDGSDLSMNYSIPATGSGVVQYSVSTIYSNSFTGNGSHNVPADVTSVSITGRGQDGTPAITEQWEYPEKTSEVHYFITGSSGSIGNVYPAVVSLTNPPATITFNYDSASATTGTYSRTFTETVDGVERKVVEYSYGFDGGGSGWITYTAHYRAYKVNVLLPQPAKRVNPVPYVPSHLQGKVGTLRYYLSIPEVSSTNLFRVTGKIYLNATGVTPEEYVEGTLPLSVSVIGTYVVRDSNYPDNTGPILDHGMWGYMYSTDVDEGGNFRYFHDLSFSSIPMQVSGNTVRVQGPGIAYYGIDFGQYFIYTDPVVGSYITYPGANYTLQAATPDLRTPATTGANTVVTFNGQTYTYPGGVGGPATSRNDVVNVTAGAVKALNYTVPQGGVVSVSYTTAATPARETTAVINGQTYTFPGSSSGAASNTTFNIDLVANYNFANGVAINQDGTLAAICSSPRAANVPGYVLILQRSGTTWTIMDELKRDDGLVWHAQSVSMDKTGNYILVGADAQPVGASKIGSFAIYRRQAGKYAVEQTVIAPDPGVAYEAGSSVSLSGNAAIAVIGAPAGGTASRVLVYERDGNSTLVLKATLSKTTDPHSSDALGTRVYISADGSTIAASSPTSRGVNTSHANCGEVLIFRKIDNVWTQVSTVRHPTPTSGLYFGQDIHLSDDGFTLSVGVPGGTGGLGEVMFFDIEGSNTVYKSNVVSSAVTGGTNFGKAIALPGHSGDLVGASKFGTYVFD